jgi:hypothetical protein
MLCNTQFLQLLSRRCIPLVDVFEIRFLQASLDAVVLIMRYPGAVKSAFGTIASVRTLASPIQRGGGGQPSVQAIINQRIEPISLSVVRILLTGGWNFV